MSNTNPERVDLNLQNRGHGWDDDGNQSGNNEPSTERRGNLRDVSAADVLNTSVASDQLLSTDPDNLSLILRLQALFMQFSHSRVRADFINNKFNWTLNPNLLEKLDDVRCLLFPRWVGGSLECQPPHRSYGAAVHLSCLARKDASICNMPGEDPAHSLTYKSLFTLLETIATDRYWDTVPAEERCTHILAETEESSGNVTGNNARHKSRKIKTKKERIDKSPVLVCISSDSESSGDSSSEGSSSTVTESYRSRRQLYDRRDVVIPPPFELDGEMTLSEYLQIYENYFIAKFNGTEKDKTQELEKFLKDDLLTVYRIRGGRKLKYKEMKKELLAWFKKEKIGGRTYWREKFQKVEPDDGETFDLYGLRLKEVARKAFIKSGSERDKQLKARFLDTIDANIAEKIRDTNRTVKATTGKKGLDFAAMTGLAREMQKEECKKVTWVKQSPQFTAGNLSFDRANAQPSSFSNRISHESRTFRTSSFNNRDHSSSRTSSGSRSKSNARCFYCKKTGHIKSEC